MKSAVEFTLKVPWGTIAAKAWGNIQNTRVLVVHGVLDNAGAFDRLIKKLPENFYYVCIDLPGHGLSSLFQPGVPLNYFSYLITIRYVLDELQWKTTYYIGHSLGANLGLLFSLVYPDRIQKLILIEGFLPKTTLNTNIISKIREECNMAVESYKFTKPRSYTKEEVIYALKNLRKSSLTSEAAEAVFPRAVTKVGNDCYIYNRDVRAKISITPIFNIDQSIAVLRNINVEILIIISTSTLDFLRDIRENIFRAFKKFNCVCIIEVKGNHDIHNNHPEKISGHITKFLNDIPSKL